MQKNNQEKITKRIEKARLSRQRSFDRKINRYKSQNSWKELVDPAFRLTLYDPRFSNANSPSHEDAKAKLARMLCFQDRPAYFEVRLKNGARPDCFIFGEETIIEVLETEELANIENKRKYYPEGWIIIALKANDILKETFVL